MHQLPDHSSRIICSDIHSHNPWKVKVSPSKLSFGNMTLNNTTVPRQLVVTNIGMRPVRIGAISVSGSYRASHNAPAILNSGQEFIIDVVFTPNAEGIHIGGVYVDTGDARGTEYASLIGYGYVAGTDPGGGESGGGSGILPKFWNWRGDGETISFPLNGADVYDKLAYDTYLSGSALGNDYYGVSPTDFVIEPPVDSLPAYIRFNVAPPEDFNGYTILRGYAKPHVGPPPIDTVAPDVDHTIIENNTIIDRTKHNALLVVNSNDPITILIRAQTGDEDKDWKQGEFFSVLQRGLGPVTLALQDPATGTLYPAKNFLPRTRDQDCVISGTCIDTDANQWVISGDMLRGSSSYERHNLTLVDRSVLIGSAMTVGGNKDSYVMPFPLRLDPIIDRGLLASLMTAQTGGNIFTVDILRNGVSILVNKLLINNGAITSVGSVTPATYAVGGDLLAMGDAITLSINQVGDGTARGLRVYLSGSRA